MVIAIFISLFAAIIPTLLYVMLFYWADRYEREPRWLATVAFFWGALPAVVISLIAELIIGEPFITTPGTIAGEVVSGSLVAPIVEELAKGAALFAIFWWKRQEFDNVLDGIIYGALVGFGFAMTENLLYFISSYAEGGFGSLTVIIFLRSILFGLNHAFYTSLIGIGLGMARNKRAFLARVLCCAVGLMAAIFAQALHNLGASLAAVNVATFLLSLMVAGGGLAITLLAIGLSWQQERNVITAELNPEIGRLLSNEEFGQLTGQWRQPDRSKRLPTKARRQLLVEYANRRYRLRRQGVEHEPELEKELDDLQAQLIQSHAPAQAAL
jgi:RsiW-degrading membrane proteinase PrsW (M82 family)